MKNKELWEKIGGYEDDNFTHRAQVPGGWLVRAILLLDGTVLSVALCFVPDAAHEWQLDASDSVQAGDKTEVIPQGMRFFKKDWNGERELTYEELRAELARISPNTHGEIFENIRLGAVFDGPNGTRFFAMLA